ncbi:hypothetical protein N8873_08945 [Flavobacteriaceae bacterium]|nr:hypothetical protein [Flavobacteriaceae bacterium]
MVRKIIDYKNVPPEILKLLAEKYPDGYDQEDIISFTNADKKYIQAVEIRTEGTIYLIKVSAQLEQAMEDVNQQADFEDNDDSEEIDFQEPLEEEE